MNLRHLRCFIAVAEELHFGRAARRLHIEQSPLSRTIRQLEADLGVTLLDRSPRSVRLTLAGQVFLEDARRVLLAFEQAQTKARAAANHRNTLRIALSGDMGQARLSALLALCREEAPRVGIRLFEAPLAQLVSGLRSDLYDAGFALAAEVDSGVVATPVWRDPLVVALPARHPLLAFKEVPLEEVASYPLVLCDPQVCEGCSRQRERLLSTVDAQPTVAEYVKRRPLTEADVQAAPGMQARYTRTAQNEIHRQFHRLPNPDLVMYVFPHLAGTDPVPVPGYSTVFPLYQRVQYAMPGERVEDY